MSISIEQSHARPAWAPWQSIVQSFGAQHAVIRTPSCDEAVEFVKNLLGPHRLKVLGSGESFTANFSASDPSSGIQISTLGYGAEVELEFCNTGDQVLVTVQTAGCSAVNSAGRHAEGGVGLVVVDSPSQTVKKRFSADSRRINLRLPRARLEAGWASLTGGRLEAPLLFDPFVKDPVRVERWALHLQLLADYLLRAPAAHPRQLDVLVESAMFAMLSLFPHNHSGMLADPPQRAGSRALRVAKDYMQHKLAEPLTLQEIADQACISVRALTDLFRRELAVSPMQHLQTLRLDAARAALVRRTGMTVAQVAGECGFSSFGRFASCYRARYGELPSQTLRRC